MGIHAAKPIEGHGTLFWQAAQGESAKRRPGRWALRWKHRRDERRIEDVRIHLSQFPSPMSTHTHEIEPAAPFPGFVFLCERPVYARCADLDGESRICRDQQGKAPPVRNVRQLAGLPQPVRGAIVTIDNAPPGWQVFSDGYRIGCPLGIGQEQGRRQPGRQMATCPSCRRDQLASCLVLGFLRHQDD